MQTHQDNGHIDETTKNKWMGMVDEHYRRLKTNGLTVNVMDIISRFQYGGSNINVTFIYDLIKYLDELGHLVVGEPCKFYIYIYIYIYIIYIHIYIYN